MGDRPGPHHAGAPDRGAAGRRRGCPDLGRALAAPRLHDDGQRRLGGRNRDPLRGLLRRPQPLPPLPAVPHLRAHEPGDGPGGGARGPLRRVLHRGPRPARRLRDAARPVDGRRPPPGSLLVHPAAERGPAGGGPPERLARTGPAGAGGHVPHRGGLVRAVHGSREDADRPDRLPALRAPVSAPPGPLPSRRGLAAAAPGRCAGGDGTVPLRGAPRGQPPVFGRVAAPLRLRGPSRRGAHRRGPAAWALPPSGRGRGRDRRDPPALGRPGALVRGGLGPKPSNPPRAWSRRRGSWP